MKARAKEKREKIKPLPALLVLRKFGLERHMVITKAKGIYDHNTAERREKSANNVNTHFKIKFQSKEQTALAS